MPRPRNMQTVLPGGRAIVLPSAVSVATGDPLADAFDEMQYLGMTPNDAISLHLKMRVSFIEEVRTLLAGLDKEMGSLVELALDQGWPVPVVDGSKLKWTNPEGGQITTPTRVVGRGFNNVKTQLRRLGLDIPNPQKKKEAEPVVAVVEEPAAPAPATPVESPLDPWAALDTLTRYVQQQTATSEAEQEWSGLCEGLEVEKEALRLQLEAVSETLDDVRTALTTSAPWEALPRIAALLGLTEEKTA